MKREIIESTDGSHTLFVPELDEHYHSVHGAIQESMHVFIEAGLRNQEKIELNIFEAGFGTGLNALLTLNEALDNNLKIHFTSIEKYPLSKEEASHLNYAKLLEKNQKEFTFMHEANWEETVPVNSSFSLEKLKGDLKNISLTKKYDLIYFDAFAPEKQPDLWSEEIFQKMYDISAPNGILVTYCAKGVVRRTMQAVGYTVERIPGPPGKRQMLRATKK